MCLSPTTISADMAGSSSSNQSSRARGRAIDGSPSRGRAPHSTPAPLPALICYRCNRATIRTKVVETDVNGNRGRRYYFCPNFDEADPTKCRIGFVWHEDYALTLQQLGILPHTDGFLEQTQSLNTPAAVSTPVIHRSNNQLAVATNAVWFPNAPTAQANQMVKALLLIGIMQLVLLLAIYLRI